MKPLFHPRLVNPPQGDPGVLVEFLFERRALLFDLGDNAALSPRTLLSVTHACVSHTHMDHFVGLDRLVRLLVGRDRRLHLFGPPGFIDQVGHKLAAYTWNLVENYASDFTLAVTELGRGDRADYAEFHSRERFERRAAATRALSDQVLIREPQLTLRYEVLDHRTPSLAYALEEAMHVNVWKNRLAERGLPVGPWLRRLKQAVLAGEPDRTPIPLPAGSGRPSLPLGELRRAVQVQPGQKVVYVTDAAGHEANAERIVTLAAGADILFIETPFLQADSDLAADKHHLTARRAGELARRAGVARLVPFHFSARYCDGAALAREAQAAFAGRPSG